MRENTNIRRRGMRLVGAVAGACVFALWTLSSIAPAAPGPIAPPIVPGAAPSPGGAAAPASAAADMGLLKVKPDTGPVGTKFTVSGTGLPAGKQVSLVWSTANVSWVLDPRPDSVDYLGKKTDSTTAVLALATTDASGAFSKQLLVPRDWGGIHDIYAVVDGVQQAKSGFEIKRTVKITPAQGAIGTPITIRVSGLGASLYGSSAAVYYDNRYSGVMTGTWSRGEATATIRAAGPVGRHEIVVAGGMQFNYLNYQQSPIPWATGGQVSFDVTEDLGSPKSSLEWPLAVQPTVSARTTMAAAGATASTAAQMELASTSGQVLSKTAVTASGLTPNAPVDLAWSTVVGNRVNCTGTCWTFQQLPLGSGRTGADGTLSTKVQIPDGLGGWHVVQLIQNGKVQAQVPYFVKRSLVEVPKKVKAGQPFQVHLKGVGWTQLDNTVAVNYDNAYVGYGCGFNSAGDVVVNLVATGGPGTHLIDIYPLLYTYQPQYQYPPHGMVPFLSFARDAPGLALGYELPAFRLAIQVVE